MDSVLEDVNAAPSYNSHVITEPDDMSAVLDQYWRLRKASRQAAIERLQLLSSNAGSERVWQDYCRRHLGFLPRLLRSGGDSFEQLLVSRLQWSRRIARTARSLFVKEAKLEVRIPLGHSPLRVVRAPGTQSAYDIVEYPAFDGTGLDAGQPMIAICWRNRDLALLLSSLNFVELDTFVLTMDGASWNTGDTLPASFLSVLPTFESELESAAEAFAKLRQTWDAADRLARATKQLEGIDRVASIWRRVHIPEQQKLELLRRFELFEDGDPAAPHGLLLKGPSGTGKTWIARALAETLDCHFQILSLPDFKMPSLGESAQRVRERWDESRQHQPSIMFVDDCEGVLTRRGAVHADKISEEIVESFLPEWDGVRERSRILLIGATNRPDLLDDAVISRFGWVMDIQLPNAENRAEIFAQEVRTLGIPIEPPPDIGTLTQGMSGRDLSNLAASLRAQGSSDRLKPEEIMKGIAAIRGTRSLRIDEQTCWDSLILNDEIIERLKIVCALLREPDDWRAHGVSIPKSLLLVGASGAGKSRAAKTIARESGLNFLAPTMAEVKATILGGSASAVQQLFERGRSMAPVIIFLDKLDTLAPRQSPFEAKDRLSEEIASQLQQEMNGVPSHEGHVFLMAETHNPDLVDEAVLNCFEERIELPLPDLQLRFRLLTVLLSGKKLGFPLDEGAHQLSGMLNAGDVSGGELARWVQAAEQRALARAIRSGGPEYLQIRIEDFSPHP